MNFAETMYSTFLHPYGDQYPERPLCSAKQPMVPQVKLGRICPDSVERLAFKYLDRRRGARQYRVRREADQFRCKSFKAIDFPAAVASVVALRIADLILIKILVRVIQTVRLPTRPGFRETGFRQAACRRPALTRRYPVFAAGRNARCNKPATATLRDDRG